MRVVVWAACLLVAFGCSSETKNEAEPQDTMEARSDVSSPDVAADSMDAVEEDLVEPIDWDAVWGTPDTVDDGKRRVVVLHTNDLHAHHNGTGPAQDYSPNSIGNDDTMGGFARIATLVEKERRNLRPGAELVVVDGGDFSFGSAFADLAKSKGTELRLMAKIGYTAAAIGNHELDWSPSGLASVVDAGIEEGSDLHLLSSNLIYSDESADDDALKALVGTKIRPYKVVTGGNGVKIGLFGLIGKGAFSLAPHAEPITARTASDAATEVIATLKDQEAVDVIICLSHSGVAEAAAKGEDETLAKNVPGMNLIVSGHTHTLMPEPVIEGSTAVVQAGYYGKHIGKAVLVESSAGVWELESWETIPVTDEIPGLPEIQEMIEGWQAELADGLFAGMEHGYHDAVAHTAKDVPTVEMAESPMGNLVADAVRWACGKYSKGGPVDVAFEANGVVRDGFRAGKTGKVLLADVLTVLPLGYGPDGHLGYPLIDFYVTAKEIRLALEVICGVAPMISDAFYLQISGLKFECNSKGKLFEQVANVWLGNEVDGYSETPLDTSEANTALYHVATNLYIGQMMSVLKGMTGGKLDITLKDKDGVALATVYDFIIDRDTGADGVQELKHWKALYEYLLSFPAGAGGLPEIPERYSAPMGRISVK